MYTHYFIDVGNPPKYLIDLISSQTTSASTILAESTLKKDNQTSYLIEILNDQTIQYDNDAYH